jgi:hypothetical protein
MSMGSVAKLAPLWSESTPSIASGANPLQIDAELQALERLGVDELRLQWRNRWGRLAPAHLSRALLFRAMAYRIQAEAFGDLDRQIARRLDRLAQEAEARTTGGAGVVDGSHPPARSRSKAIGLDSPLVLKPGALLTREWQGRIERVIALDEGFAWNGKTYASLSAVAFAITGTKWNGHRFFFGAKGRHAGGRERGKAARIEGRRHSRDPTSSAEAAP